MNLIVSNDHGTSRAACLAVPANEERNEMAYVVEKITPEDQQKILRDAACDPEKMKTLSNGFRDGFVHGWIVDRERDCYMIGKPRFVRMDAEDFRRYFFFKGCMYEISQLSFFGYDVAIIDMPPESQLEEFKQEVTAACMATGPDSAFTPIFKFGKGE